MQPLKEKTTCSDTHPNNNFFVCAEKYRRCIYGFFLFPEQLLLLPCMLQPAVNVLKRRRMSPFSLAFFFYVHLETDRQAQNIYLVHTVFTRRATAEAYCLSNVPPFFFLSSSLTYVLNMPRCLSAGSTTATTSNTHAVVVV